MKYVARIYDTLLHEKLQSSGATLVEGPKWCGKTTTCLQACKSKLLMQDPAVRQSNLELAEISPQLLLEGKTPRLIDEWQLAPSIWDSVRCEVDQRQKMGQFLLTGSSTPPDVSAISHSGAGRINRVKMRTMSLFESGDSNGKVSLNALFDSNANVAASAKSEIDEIAYLICRGGWPASIGRSERVSLAQPYDYIDAIVQVDLKNFSGIKRNPQRIKDVMRIYARYTAGQGTVSKMLADLHGSDVGISDATLRNYLEALENMFVIEELNSWNPNLRSKAAVRTTPVRYFVDSSIAAAVLGVNPKGLLSDLETFGLLFEGMCIRDLRVYMDANGGQVSHYRDSNGLECDAVVHKRNGEYGLIEVKLGGSRLIEEGAANLNRFESIIDSKKQGAPKFKMVLIGVGEYAYRRKDGVLVIPICSLKD